MVYFEYDNGTTGEYIISTGEAPGTNRLEITYDMGKVVVEGKQLLFRKNYMSKRKFNKISTKPFGHLEYWDCTIPVDFFGGEQHVGIMKNFATAVLNSTELLARVEEGINGLTISNVIHLSVWTGETVNVKNLPGEKYYNLLQEKIRNSTVVKKES